MWFAQLPYELITQISLFLDIPDLLSLALTNSTIHARLGYRLGIHKHKLATLSSVDDRNRPSVTPALRSLFRNQEIWMDHVEYDNPWYFREVVIHAFSDPFSVSIPNYLAHRCNPCLPDGERFPVKESITEDLRLTWDWYKGMSSKHLEVSQGFEVLMSLALLVMPRLSKLRFLLHPCHRHKFATLEVDGLQYRSGNTRYQVFELFTELLWWNAHHISRSPQTFSWPPGLQSLRSLEIQTEDLHGFCGFPYSNRNEDRPRTEIAYLRALFWLPNLKRLLFTRYPSNEVEWLNDSDIEGFDHLDRQSPIEELVLVGCGQWRRVTDSIIRSIRRLRFFVLEQRGNECGLTDLVNTLKSRHASSLEIFVPPSLTSNALSWCQGFPHLKHLTVSYVEVMSIFQQQQKHFSTSSQHCEATSDRVSILRTAIPRTVEFLAFIGGRQSSAITSVKFIPNDQDIQNFIDMVVLLVSARGATPECDSQPGLHDESLNLRDVCFGDMRIAIAPCNAEEGQRIARSSTHDGENERLGLGKAIKKSRPLQESCLSHGVRLHFVDLQTRICDHAERHPEPMRKRLSRQELVEKATRLSEGADATTKAILSQYVGAIPQEC